MASLSHGPSVFRVFIKRAIFYEKSEFVDSVSVKTCDEHIPGVYLVTRFLEYTSDLLLLSNVT